MGVILTQTFLVLKLGAVVLGLNGGLPRKRLEKPYSSACVIVNVKILGVLVIVVERSYLRSKERLSTCKSNNWKETRWCYCECS